MSCVNLCTSPINEAENHLVYKYKMVIILCKNFCLGKSFYSILLTCYLSVVDLMCVGRYFKR